ncbi:hypothetical protein B0H19DRAFT_1262142 [Mycena capillaripes]|nr:hypothetical protein B0H19DRAFT_1262142 [Mycena capillaripes]
MSPAGISRNPTDLSLCGAPSPCTQRLTIESDDHMPGAIKFQYTDLFGSILISSWLSTILYGVVLCLTWQYVWTYPSDARFRKGLLLCCLFTSSLAMIAQLANVFYPTVTFWGDTIAIQKQYWPVPVYVICNSLTGVMVDSFLITRVYLLSKNIWIALFLGGCVVIGLAGSIMVSVIISMASDISARNHAATAALIWTVGTAAADICIAAALIWKLVTMRTSFKRTNSLIRRLVIGAIQTGSATSVIAVATLVAFYIGKSSSNVPTAFHYLIGPLYVLTLLYNFNLRKHTGVSGSGRSGTGRTTDTRLTGTIIYMDGIEVHRRTTVSMDPSVANVPSGVDPVESYGETKLNDNRDGATKIHVASF